MAEDYVRQSESENDAQRAALGRSISNLPVAMVVTDPSLPDNPIVYVNDAFAKVTLYSREMAVGRNCRFLQGKDTDPQDVAELRRGIDSGRQVSVDILNYRADGTSFHNRLLITPVEGPDGEALAYVGVQTEMGDEHSDDRDNMLRELQHRVKNHLAMVVSLIRMQARREISEEAMTALSQRVQSLALLYEELTPTGVGHVHDDTVPAGAYLSRIVHTIGALDGRASIRVNVDCEEIDLPVEAAARLGLVLTELLTNALEHAFEGRDEGFVSVRLARHTRGGIRLMVEDDGVGLPGGSAWPSGSTSIEDQSREAERTGSVKGGLGGSIVAAMVESLGATIDVSSHTSGTVATVDLPLQKLGKPDALVARPN